MERPRKLSSRSSGTGCIESTAASLKPLVFIVDDDSSIRAGVCELCKWEGYDVEAYADCELFLKSFHPERPACLVVDAYLPGMSGIELLGFLATSGCSMPSIVMTGRSDIPSAVLAMKAGALDYVQKPVSSVKLLEILSVATKKAAEAGGRYTVVAEAKVKIALLTPRQHEIMDLVLAGQPSKNIASDLGISQRTVENHRAAIMKRTGSASLPALTRLAVTASGRGRGQGFATEI